VLTHRVGYYAGGPYAYSGGYRGWNDYATRNGFASVAPATVADLSAKAREQEAFAQLQPSDANQLQPSDPKKREAKLQRQRRIAKRRGMQPTVLARQPQFGWFGNSIW
jgi:hypothetical protein